MKDNRTYHTLVPMSIVSADMFPGLALSSEPVQSNDLPMDQLRLRPLAGIRQPFYVFVKNPSPKAWNVIVEIWEGDKKLAATGEEKPLTVQAGSSLAVTGFGTPAPKPGVPLRELAGPLRLRLRDPAGVEFDKQTIPIAIAAPRDYIEVTQAQFTPGIPNQLKVILRALPQMTGRPCPVELFLPMDKELFPTLRVPPKDGKLTGELEPGKLLTLYAEKLALDPNDDAEGSFALDVDGVKRALWFRGRFPQEGGTQRMSEPQKARVRFHADRLVEPNKKARLRVAFAVDNAPPDARLSFELGRYQGGRLKGDFDPWDAPAKKRHLGFDPGGEGGALLFEAAIEDQVWEREVPGLRGPRRLLARLLDSRGRRVLDTWELDLILDDQKPQNMALEVRDQIEKGTRNLPVRATATPPQSKIKEVEFIFGPPGDFEKAAAARQAFPGQPEDPDGQSWTATLPVPKDAAGKLVVSARFKTGVGLTDFAPPVEVAVIEPAPQGGAANPAAPKLGAIEGIVKEGDRPQASLKVYLVDLMPQPTKGALVDQKLTDDNGAFSFKDLEPKRYQLYCEKQSSDGKRSADPKVMVEAGKTLKVALELVR
jgi:hypothetical protein